MIRETVTVDDVLELLERVRELDPVATRALVETRVLCGPALADHSTVQVQKPAGRRPPSGVYEVGLLGILNGIFGTDDRGMGPITACYAVACPMGCDLEVFDEAVAGAPCPACGGGTLQEERLVRFARMPGTEPAPAGEGPDEG